MDILELEQHIEHVKVYMKQNQFSSILKVPTF